ncbi:expressed protein [Phakopsora pachyrhizi]|uniref:Expressed protein n=1 Tax=Phakopsora pachyrhizi TaxID=170000 RepID=A0AAV0AS98_PHAPC|nr:expressed protein [Phakopsora pachyrhizi]
MDSPERNRTDSQSHQVVNQDSDQVDVRSRRVAVVRDQSKSSLKGLKFKKSSGASTSSKVRRRNNTNDDKEEEEVEKDNGDGDGVSESKAKGNSVDNQDLINPAGNWSDDHLMKEQEDRSRTFTEFTEEYYDIVEELPLELGRTLTLIGELEASVEECRQELHEDLTEYLSFTSNSLQQYQLNNQDPLLIDREEMAKKLIEAAQLETFGAIPLQQPLERPSSTNLPDHLRSLLVEISKKMVRLGELSRDKLNLAETMYEGLDRHLKRLDGDLEKYQDLVDEDEEANWRNQAEECVPPQEDKQQDPSVKPISAGSQRSVDKEEEEEEESIEKILETDLLDESLKRQPTSSDKNQRARTSSSKNVSPMDQPDTPSKNDRRLKSQRISGSNVSSPSRSTRQSNSKSHFKGII